MIRITSRVEQQQGAGQDRISISHHEDSITIVLADGAGGVSGGEQASNYIVASLASKSFPQFPVVLVDAVLSIDGELMHSNSMGESTVILITIEGLSFTGAAVGDSEIYFYNFGELSNLAEHKERKPNLGSSGSFPATFQGVLNGGRLLACSDGLWKYSTLEKIKSTLAIDDLESAADALVQSVRLPNDKLQDDVSLVLIEKMS